MFFGKSLCGKSEFLQKLEKKIFKRNSLVLSISGYKPTKGSAGNKPLKPEIGYW